MKLTNIEYDALMQAIENAKSTIEQDEFIDPYGENQEGYTNETLFAALERVENKLISAHNPL